MNIKDSLISLALFATGVTSLAFMLLAYDDVFVVGMVWGFGFLKLKMRYEVR